VFAFFFDPTRKPCAECGVSVDMALADAHACEEENRIEHRMFHLRHEIAAFDTDLHAWLGSADGRFAVWLAERNR
jgi:hypothetical protein